MYQKLLKVSVISGDSVFTFKEVSFATGLSNHEISALMVGSAYPYTLSDLNSKLQTTDIKKGRLFSSIIEQVNMRLWNKMFELQVRRDDNGDGTFSYPSLHSGATSLIKKHSTVEQKREFVDIMTRTKFDVNWKVGDKDVWVRDLEVRVGLRVEPKREEGDECIK